MLASVKLAAHAYGAPDITAPPANTSGYVAIMTSVMIPPAEMPVTNTRAGSLPRVDFMLSTICLIDSASP